ncbi:hypothetical protein BIV59_04305 [Bacillus sp. MUM 13]|nr:hypothetical protein BIV59_04305 [Bacillus sp. MUM 13]
MGRSYRRSRNDNRPVMPLPVNSLCKQKKRLPITGCLQKGGILEKHSYSKRGRIKCFRLK